MTQSLGPILPANDSTEAELLARLEATDPGFIQRVAARLQLDSVLRANLKPR